MPVSVSSVSAAVDNQNNVSLSLVTIEQAVSGIMCL